MTVPENFGQNINRPPRDVPLLVKLRVLLGGGISQFGWIFFGFSSIFMWFFGSMSDFDSWFRFGGAVETQGKVTAAEATSASVNDRDVVENRFEFTVDDQTHHGVSYTTGGTVRVGEEVTIKYVPSNPRMSKIKGQRNNLFPGFVMLFVGIFPMVGLLIVGSVLATRVKALRLLVHGFEALGKLVDKKATGTVINDDRVYKLTFEFEVDGKSHKCIAKSHKTERLEDDELEPILYSADDPKCSVAIDSLPGMPRILGDGSVRETRVFSFLIAPALAIVGNIVCLLLF